MMTMCLHIFQAFCTLSLTCFPYAAHDAAVLPLTFCPNDRKFVNEYFLKQLGEELYKHCRVMFAGGDTVV